ncbi:phosphate/phosphite/phosphonate ABC transporter substrate-binding protein [Enemella sp. A6]|uniref:phosphate/phosphite/phosphonate ABC transporter substrate-binding protein n=1 Tax=Enemella sp. A6 TaxID=3440152 RepID=UPI003EBF4D2C
MGIWKRPRTIIAVSVLALSGLGLTACASDTAALEGDETDTVRMAVTDLQGMEELQREFGAFKKTFEDKTGYTLEFYPVNDRTAAAAALTSDRVDLVFTGPAEYVVLHERTDAEPVVSIERPGYRSVIYTSAESGVTKLEDLKGKKVAMSDIGSTSGHLGPSQLLMDGGVNPLEELEVVTVGDAVHQALVRGDVAAVGIGHHDYEEFTEGQADTFPVLVEGDPLPADVIMVRKGFDEKATAKIKEAFVENWDELLAAMLEGKDNAKYQDARLIESTDADYDRVRDMYRAIGVDDFANAPK